MENDGHEEAGAVDFLGWTGTVLEVRETAFKLVEKRRLIDVVDEECEVEGGDHLLHVLNWW